MPIQLNQVCRHGNLSGGDGKIEKEDGDPGEKKIGLEIALGHNNRHMVTEAMKSGYNATYLGDDCACLSTSQDILFELIIWGEEKSRTQAKRAQINADVPNVLIRSRT